jgi:uncharacterized damage-inducible protein DinB
MTMNETEFIANEITEAFERGKWGGGPVGDLFQSFSADEAASRPIPNAHSAWEIALHMTTWHRIFASRLSGNEIPYSEEIDWPSVGEITADRWSAVVDELVRAAAELAFAVRELDSARLDDTVPGKEFTFREMLHGAPQHDQYHSGQVRMLRKMLDQEKS